MSVSERPATRLWREALAQLDELLQQSSDQRERSLAGIRQSHPQLHAMLLSLLQAEAQAEDAGFLEPPAFEARHALQSGAQLGPYRILSPLGSGGMGEVWLAHRDDGLYQGEVAIKTLHPYFGGGALRERFLREAELLGRLAHPNIARLLDAGMAPDGSVYLVLEYVRGIAIDTWCDERKLDIRQRLRLLLEVCAAVAHAHSNLVVHRDLKPSNILVTDEGQVKLLDFGVAKLIESDAASDRTELTRLTGRIFTPEYAAPEQILGQPVTTATDVYALGVLLHVLLTSTRPYGSSSNPVEIERAVLHDEPVKASRAVAAANPAEIAAGRATTPVRLQRELAGDLDNIIERALGKAKEARYPSVAALADDVRRHLDHQPILARPAGLSVRAWKFVRRHRLGVAASLLVVLALGTGVAGVLWQAQVARTEAAKATAIKDFLVGVFERNSTSHPDGAQARETTAEELLSQAAKDIRGGLTEAPEVRTELLGVMARLYANMEMQKDALPLLEERLAAQRAALGRSDPAVARTLTELARSQVQSGDYPAAERHALEAQQMFRAHGEESALEYAETYIVLGQVQYRLGRHRDEEHLRTYQTGLELVTTHHPRHSTRLVLLRGMARAEQALGRHDLALERSQEAAALIEAGAVDADGIERGGVFQSLGDTLNWASRNDEAEHYLRKAVVEYEQAGGPDHPYVSDGKRALAMLLAWSGRRSEAKDLLQSAFEAQRRVRGDDDPQLTTVIRLDLGRVLLMRGEYVESERHLQRVVDLWRVSGAPTVNTTIQLARLHTEQGRFDLAAAELEGLEEKAAQLHGPGSWVHATAINREATFHLAQGKLAQAQHLFERTDKEANDLPGMSPNRAYARVGLLRIALTRGDPGAVDMAANLLPQIESAAARAEMPDEEAAAHMLLGVALLRAGKVQEAQSHLETAVAMRERMDAMESPLLAEARLYLAQQQHLAREREAARRLISQAVAAHGMQQVGPQHRQLLADTRHMTSL